VCRQAKEYSSLLLILAIAAMSANFIKGFVGVSTQNQFGVLINQ
jgi:hypothetical protein